MYTILHVVEWWYPGTRRRACVCAVVFSMRGRWCSQSHSLSASSRSSSTCVRVIVVIVRRVSVVAEKVVMVLSAVLASMCAVVVAGQADSTGCRHRLSLCR